VKGSPEDYAEGRSSMDVRLLGVCAVWPIDWQPRQAEHAHCTPTAHKLVLIQEGEKQTPLLVIMAIRVKVALLSDSVRGSHLTSRRVG
jgi:hypothetical protein